MATDLTKVYRKHELPQGKNGLGGPEEKTSGANRQKIGPESASLLESAAFWEGQPSIAFEALLLSNQFRLSNRSSMSLPQNHQIKQASAVVYVSMFGKYCRSLSERDKSFLQSTPADVKVFMEEWLADASSETRGRYIRLLERVFDHLVARNIATDNPVNTWVREMLMTNRSAVVGPKATPDLVKVHTIDGLRDWFLARSQRAIKSGDWRLARDITMSSISLGAGMRCAELLKLTRNQIRFDNAIRGSDRFIFNIPGWASVKTAQAHRTQAERKTVELMELWWSHRWIGFPGDKPDTLVLPGGDQVFPSTLTGKRMTEATLYRNLKEICQAAVDDGVLDDSTRWVLERGAQGLRRAYALTELERGKPPELLKERMGLFHMRSVRRYIQPGEDLAE